MSIMTQSEYRRMILPPATCHSRPALPMWSMGRLGEQPNRLKASQPISAALSAQFGVASMKNSQSATNWCQRCSGTSIVARM